MFRTRALARLVIPVLVATTTQTLVAGDSVGTTPPAKSIREWKTNPIATPPANPAANPAANAAATSTASPVAKPAVTATAPKSAITISITSALRQGNLVVVLDDVPIFNGKFQKPLLLMSQTTRWDPLQIAAGKHRLSAKVYGTNKTYFSASYDLDVSRTKASELRFVVHGDKLTVELVS